MGGSGLGALDGRVKARVGSVVAWATGGAVRRWADFAVAVGATARSGGDIAEGKTMAKLTMDYWRDGVWYVGRLREVPGVFSQGRTLRELETNLRDAYRLVLQDQPTIPHARNVSHRTLAVAV
jgi:predicted RNase H-like HicB family nuclease